MARRTLQFEVGPGKLVGMNWAGSQQGGWTRAEVVGAKQGKWAHMGRESCAELPTDKIGED